MERPLVSSEAEKERLRDSIARARDLDPEQDQVTCANGLREHPKAGEYLPELGTVDP